MWINKRTGRKKGQYIILKIICVYKYIINKREGERQRDRERDRETDRETERQTGRQTD